MLDGSSVLRRDRDLLEAPLDRDRVGLDSDSGLCYGFNETAAAVWDLLAEPMTLDALVAQLGRQFDMAGDGPREDVVRLVREMADEGLIAVTAAP